MLFSFFKEHLDSYYEISDSQLLHSSYQADNKNNHIRSVMCQTETYWCLGATVSFLPTAFYNLLRYKKIWKLMSSSVTRHSHASNAGEDMGYRHCIIYAAKTAGALFGQEKKKKILQSNPPVCACHTRVTGGTRWVPKGKKNTVPCWILNVPETVSNQRQGCSEGADEKYLRLIILARKLMAGRKEEER